MRQPTRAGSPVVIVGGGFAGIEAAKVLARAGVWLTVVDQRHHHLFQPLLYQVATAALRRATSPRPSGRCCAATRTSGAMQTGRHAARNILRASRGEPMREFRFNDKGAMATIGRAAAVVDLGRVQFGGFIAWLTWLFVHIFYLIGFKNRVLVLLQWAWSNVTYARGTRLITGTAKTPRSVELPEENLAPTLPPMAPVT